MRPGLIVAVLTGVVCWSTTDTFAAEAIDSPAMQRVYNEIRTPHKFGIVVPAPEGKKVDCPTVFRYGEQWYMTYIVFDGRGYETRLAKSADLVSWKTLGTILAFRENTWDANQSAGFPSLIDTTWGKPCAIQSHDGKYWLSYVGGSETGYETGRLGLGIAWAKTPDRAEPWNRIDENPVLRPDEDGTRWWENVKLYKSIVIRDDAKTLGSPFVMFYNAAGDGDGHVFAERIGIALSDDMVHWQRYRTEPVIDNGPRISGDPQLVKMGKLWVMFYFRYNGEEDAKPAFDTFACSRDLVHWTKWQGEPLIQASEPWDATHAHKPWVLKHDGIVYHYYCAVGDQGRSIALATSEKIERSE